MRIWGAVTRGERGIRIAYLIPAEATVAERADHGRFLMWHKGAARRLLCLTSSAAFIAGVALVSHAFFFGRDVLGLELAGLGGVGLAALVFADGLLRPAGDVRTMMARMPGPDRPEAAWTGVWGLIEAHDHAGQLATQGSYPYRTGVRCRLRCGSWPAGTTAGQSGPHPRPHAKRTGVATVSGLGSPTVPSARWRCLNWRGSGCTAARLVRSHVIAATTSHDSLKVGSRSTHGHTLG